MVFRWRNVRRRFRFFIICITFLFVTIVFFIEKGMQIITCSPMMSEENNKKLRHHQLCVTIPYRNRWTELQRMIPMLNSFLTEQGISSPIYIVCNQSDGFRFNRGSLINIGSLEAERMGCDYMAIHDVDIVPLNPELSYRYPLDRIVHITSGKYHPIARYDYKTFIGGVLIITLTDFKKVNGMANDYWGWGLEDDDFYARLRICWLGTARSHIKLFRLAGLASRIQRPTNLKSNRTNTFLHIHERTRRRDYLREDYKRKRRRKNRNSSTNGLSNIAYKLQRRHTINMQSAYLSVLDLELFCNPDFMCYAQSK